LIKKINYQIDDMTDDLTVFIGVIDLEGRLVFGNRAPLENSGVDRDQVLNKLFWEGPWFQNSNEATRLVRQAFNRAVAGETVRDEILVQMGGHKIWIEILVHPILDNDGEVSYVVAEGLTVNRLKKIEAKLLALNTELEVRVAQRTEELKAANSALRVLSETDHLTQLPNRQAYERRLEENIATGRRANQCLSLLMIDIDYFKEYNDNYGHGCGDIALRTIAGKIAQSVPRKTDLPARFGGEEFVVLLPATEMGAALAIADRIRVGVEALAIDHAGAKHCRVITVSIGVTTLIGKALNEFDLLNQADQALYVAKDTGRNKCRTYLAEQQ